MNKAFRFIGGNYKLVVLARTLADAREYVRGQAASSITHRGLRYVGDGHTADTAGWVAAVAKWRNQHVSS